MTAGPIRVLLAEDSATARELLMAILETHAAIRVVGCAADGEEAVRLTKQLRPDLVLMDAQMPMMNGFNATKTIMIECPTPIVIVSAWVNSQEINVSMEALRMGALAVLEKPVGPTAPSFRKSCAEIVETVIAMADVRTVRHWPARQPATAVTRAPGRASFDAVVIAASTGGPQALGKLFSQLTTSFPVPILVVQHIGHHFLPGFAQWLNTCTGMHVKLAETGEVVRNGTVYIPAMDRHLVLDGDRKLVLSTAPPVAGFRPSADVLFESAAKAYGRSVLAVVLTGMGTDGAAGASKVKAAGGFVIAQDEATSVVFGMPRAAIDAGCVDEVMPLSAIAQKLRQLADAKQRGA